MDSLLAGTSSNGNTCEFPEDISQGNSQPRKKEQAGRLQRRLRGLKGLLTKDVTGCIDKIKHFKSKYPDEASETTSIQIDYIRDILASLERCHDRYTNLEKALEELKMLLCDTWEEEDDDELEKALDKLTQDHALYEAKYLKITRENDDTIERCKSILLASVPKVSNKTRTTGGGNQTAPPNTCFKPQSDLKPTYLARDCTLPEFITFTKTFIIYMNSAGTAIPRDAVFSHLRVYMDPWWYTELGHKGLDINTDLFNFPKIMDIVSREQFPIHSRRMRVFQLQQKADTMSFLREIMENIRLQKYRVAWV